LVKRGTWVQVHNIVLKPEERLAHLPEDTRKCPLEMWVKGFLNQDAYIGEMAGITTVTGRTVTGELIEVNPGYIHDFGDCVPELVPIGLRLRKMLEGSEMDE
jgi:hypothetical protein